MTPSVNTTQITLPVGTPVHLRMNDKGTFKVAIVHKPGTYTVEERMLPGPDGDDIYYVKHYSIVRNYDGVLYNGWHVWKKDLRPHKINTI